jgi:hypothetical protein
MLIKRYNKNVSRFPQQWLCGKNPVAPETSSLVAFACNGQARGSIEATNHGEPAYREPGWGGRVATRQTILIMLI